MPEPLLTLTDHPLSGIFKTGYSQFHSPYGLDGLAQEDEDRQRLDILAITAREPGTGQLRKFIKAAQARYKTIAVWEIWNTGLQAVLMRYGFEKAMKIDLDGMVNHGMMWCDDKKPPPF